MANEITRAVMTGAARDIFDETLMIINTLIGQYESLVKWKDTVEQRGTTVKFPVLGTIASSDVTAGTEGTSFTTNTQLTNTAISAQVGEHLIRSVVTRLQLQDSYTDTIQEAAVLHANAVFAKLEDDIVNLFSGFSQTVAGAGVTMTETHWLSAIRQVFSANGIQQGSPNQLRAVISPKQYYGAKGVAGMSIDMDANSGRIGEEFKGQGYIDQLFGIPIKLSNEINEDVASGGDAAGGIFNPKAIGVHWKGLLQDFEFDIDMRGFTIMSAGQWKEVEIKDTWGVYFLSDVA